MIDYSPKNIRMWSMLGEAGTAGYVLDKLAESNENLAVLTADLCFYSGLERFKTNHPSQFYNMGIAEQNMVAAGAAMAKEGLNVFATTYATFAVSRALDQVRVSMGYMQLPLKILGLAAGVSGGILGATHMSYEDLAIMRSIPDVVVICPADCTETAKAIEQSEKLDCPVYIRLGAGQRTTIVYQNDYPFEIGKAVVLCDGNDILLVATGRMVATAVNLANNLEQEGISCSVVDIHTIKPIDKDFLKKTLDYKLIVTMEEHSIIGGLGGAIAEYLCQFPKHPVLCRMGLYDRYAHAAPYETLLEQNELTEKQMKQKVLELYKQNKIIPEGL